MAYGILKCDQITFTNGGIDQTVTVSGIVQSISGNITATGTIQGATIIGTSTVSGATVTGNAGVFTTVTGGSAGFTTVTGTTVTGTTANFATLSGTTITGSVGNFSSGSAAAPSVSVGTTDNGIYSPGTDQVAISTNGTGRLFVDASGNVGVGTAAPSYSFHSASGAVGITSFANGIDGASEVGLLLRGASGSHNTSLLFSSSNTNFRTRQYFNVLDGSLRWDTSSDGSVFAERLRITSDGKLGLGTSSPYSRFTVIPTSNPTTPATANQITIGESSGNSNYRLQLGYFQATQYRGSIQSYDNGSPFDLILNGAGGNVGVGTTSPVGPLDIVTGTNRGYFDDAAGSLFRLNAVNAANSAYAPLSLNGSVLTFQIGASERARIDSSGRLLVGTSSYSGSGIGFEVEGTGNFGPQLITTAKGSDPYPTYIIYRKSRGSSIVQNDDFLFDISGSGYDGSNYLPAATIRCDVDGTPGSNDMPGRLVFSTNGGAPNTSPTERLRITNNGLVGINTTAPAATLDVYGSARLGAANTQAAPASSVAGGCHFSWNFVAGSAETDIYNLYDNAPKSFLFRQKTGATTAQDVLQIGTTEHVFFIGGTERARIDSSGRLLVGASSALTATDVSKSKLVVNGDTDGSGYPGRIALNNSVATVLANYKLGELYFSGQAAGNAAASIACFAESDWNTAGDPTDNPGYLVFSTTADGASSPTERMRITSAGTTSINTGSTNVAVNTGTTDGATFYAPSAGAGILQLSADGDICAYFRRRSSDGSILQFRRDTTSVGTISVTTTATAYNTSSDYRLKENVTPVTDGITRLQQLKPSRFNFIADPDTTVDGFLAHEVQTVVPEAITGEKDAVDAEGNPEYQGIDQSKLVPLLTAALQEAVAKIESLEARLTAAGL